VKYQFIYEYRHIYPIIRMCNVLEVSENGYYNWLKRGKSQRKRDDEQLASRIEDAYHENRGVYGSPRIHAELKAQGFHYGRKRIARLMRERNISARKKGRQAKKTDSNHSSPIAPNLLERDFTADVPNKKWMTDMTFIATGEGWLYLAGVIDAYSRRLIGWAMGLEHDAELVKQALHMALVMRQPGAGLVHHSDRGSEYASKSYQEILHQYNIQISMSRKGDCYDNAMIESFWGTLKEECFGLEVFHTIKEAKTAIFEYIEVFYNRKRRHSSLGYLSPLDYEKQGMIVESTIS
jgi:transposase InsO family protein